ncbi:E3 ubiquitin-protein ligase Topors [Cynara cardunculus var. scolymus]|uniref:E3 ubiquitin-protein ligase Topors n=1 Tax=Cynara cardunculus var. scolymus TaxID=59895 RepID=UPI000D6298DB|nr:E3 ubiquitin-protein ligase Topors [Cynara cardunculus var. scolymus]
MESSSSRCRRSSYGNRERFLNKHLGPAIMGKSCPICLCRIEEAALITVCLHAYCTNCIRKWSNLKRKCPLCNAPFASLFVGIDFNSRTFRTIHLSALREYGGKFNTNIGDLDGRRRDFMAQRRVIGISREELNVVNRRTRALPRQRSFGQSKMLPPGVNKERILQWRTSIYEQNLRAVPCPSRGSLEQGVMGRNSNRERLLKRIEPWIHRELHAALGDPDPTILVHLVTSIFISSLEEAHKVPSRPSGVEKKYLEPLQPFLFERTSTFWHELRCFAESSFNMETYDTVVKYVKWSN